MIGGVSLNGDVVDDDWKEGAPKFWVSEEGD